MFPEARASSLGADVNLLSTAIARARTTDDQLAAIIGNALMHRPSAAKHMPVVASNRIARESQELGAHLYGPSFITRREPRQSAEADT